MTATWSILSPALAPGAIGIIEVAAPTARQLDEALAHAQILHVPTGQARLRNLAGIDQGIVARPTPHRCLLMPHGGVELVRRLTRKLTDAGIAHEPNAGPEYPEADSPLESRMLATLSRAASPLAIDLLLDQPRRWAAGGQSSTDLDRILNRLIDPPLVVALGAANVGKSTLVNTLSGRAVSIVADAPGTTRDHVGVTLDLAGLVVRYLDTPGLRATTDPIEAQAQRLSLLAAQQADLILLLGDALSPPPPPSQPSSSSDKPAPPTVTIALRSDLGAAPWPHDLSLSARHNTGIESLVRLIKERLIPPSALSDPRPWRFWNEPLPALLAQPGSSISHPRF